ncbi:MULTISPECIES: TetR/AcrR family transcriptional regulator C-terminal domain-containing protein [unclassified Streptomyces]|nr:TetR/AcrR family transcriptional regulator C-terminal domain-containing protein [Streptomyces sp. NBC_00523]WUD02426.1 TetR/AcrR family transcriptional regulator [Streptomyces sp. NBC_00523]
MAGAAGRSKRTGPRDMRAGVELLWGERERPARGPKPSLTPRRIADEAVAVADAEGLDAVSMGRVAAGLGVSGMALYRYVPGKTELVELMVEVALADVPDLADAGPGWRERLAAWSRRSRQVYADHPWLLAATAMRRQIMGPHQLGWLDAAHAALEPTGLGAADRQQVVLLLIGQVRSLAQQTADFDAEHAREWGRLTGELLERHADRFPALTRAIAAGAFDASGTDSPDFGLDRILDGVQVLIDAAAP